MPTQETKAQNGATRLGNLRRTRASVFAFFSWLWSKLRTSFQKRNSPIRHEDNTNDERTDSKNKRSQAIPSESNSPPAPTNKKHSRKKWRECLEIARFVVEVLALIGLVVYAAITYLMYCETKKAANAAHDSAVAAKSAADTADATLKSSQKSFEIDQRPYLIVEEVPQFVAPGPVANTGIKVSVYLKSIGRTPAAKEITNVRLLPYHGSKDRSKYIAFIESAFADIQKKNARARKELSRLENLSVSAEQDVAPTQHFFTTSQEIVKLSATEEQMVKTGELTLFFVGVTNYVDAFNNGYETQLCYFYFGDDPKTWHICDSHNVIH